MASSFETTSAISSAILRSYPPRRIRQGNTIRYYRRISRILKQSNFENSNSWKITICIVLPVIHLLRAKSNLRNTLEAQNTMLKFEIVPQSTAIRVDSTTASQLSDFGKFRFSPVVRNPLVSELPVTKIVHNEYGFTN